MLNGNKPIQCIRVDIDKRWSLSLSNIGHDTGCEVAVIDESRDFSNGERIILDYTIYPWTNNADGLVTLILDAKKYIKNIEKKESNNDS
tara:strand:+ start:4750 stop:5016 length:267 start_codon:yes stop_codon:yes gene_type:complete